MSVLPPATPPADGQWSVATAFQMGAGHYVQHIVAAASVHLPGGVAFAMVETVPDPDRPAAFAHAICNAFCDVVAKEAASARPHRQPTKALHLLRAGVEAKGVADDLRQCPDQTALGQTDPTGVRVAQPFGGALLAVLANDGGLACAFVGDPTLWLLGPEGSWSKCDAILRHARLLRDETTANREQLLREVLFCEVSDVRCAYAVTAALVRDASQATVTGGFQIPQNPLEAARVAHQLLRTSLGKQRDNPETSDGVAVTCAVRCLRDEVGRRIARAALYWSMAGAFGIGALVGASVLQSPLYPGQPAEPAHEAQATAAPVSPAVPAQLPEAATAAVADLLPDCPVEGVPAPASAAPEPTPAVGAP